MDYSPDVNNFRLWSDNTVDIKSLAYFPEDPQSIVDQATQGFAKDRKASQWEIEEGSFFYASEDPNAHLFKIDATANSAESRCIAVMDLPKFDPISEEILGEYEVQIGIVANNPTDPSATPKISKRHKSKANITIKAPQYSEDIVGEVSKNSEVFKDIFMDSGFVPI